MSVADDDLARAFKILEAYGVTQERMRGRVSIGIEVLVTRMDRQIAALHSDNQRLDARLTRVTAELRKVLE